MDKKYNLKSPGVKRLMREAIELAQPTEEYSASPLEENLFEWHFTVRGPSNTEFQGGFYHGRILLPSQYPMKPPDIILLTPNGRFETNKKICLSISGHHPESWQPSWSIRTALLALIAFMPTKPGGTIGSLDYTFDERQQLAKKSQSWECATCGKISEKLTSNLASSITPEERILLKQITLKAEEDVIKNHEKPTNVPAVSQTCNDSGRNNEVQQNVLPTNIPETVLQTSGYDRRDNIWSACIWLLLLTIGILISRRIFYFDYHLS